MIEFKLPSLGADMDEGKLVAWKVSPGDTVKKGQIVAIVDTSKAAVDVESWQEGTVAELIVQPGETVPVGTVLALFLEPGATPGAAKAAQKAAPPAARRPVSPAARKRAAELGLDVETIAGSGPGGAVTVEDVDTAAPKPRSERPTGTPGEGGAMPGKGAAMPDKSAAMRRAIAAAMSRSKREIPHYYLSETVPMAQALAWLAAENEKRDMGERLLPAVLQLKAVALALRNFPDLNGHFQDGAHVPGGGIHLGVAISLRQGGLIAPAIHAADTLGLGALMRALTDLVQRARAGSLKSSEMSDPTVTVTNLGDQGAEAVFPVIYPPQVAIVGFGRITERPWAEDGRLVAQPVVTASLGADHRVSDGHRGALFLRELADLLQHPEDLEK